MKNNWGQTPSPSASSRLALLIRIPPHPNPLPPGARDVLTALDESPRPVSKDDVKLPNIDRVQISQAKAVEYLLSPTHPEGAGKAEFFAAMGFRHEEWQTLAEALRQVARDFPVTKSMTSPHGRKYIIDGVLPTPSGRTPIVRTVWIVDAGTETPRLVTAYPKEQEPGL